MSIQYNYSIEDQELLRQIQELRTLLQIEMENRARLDTEVRFLQNQLSQLVPDIKITEVSISPLSDMILSILAKFHKSGYPYVDFPSLYEKIRFSGLYSDKPDSAKNDIETAIHNALNGLEYKRLIVSEDKGSNRRIRLSDYIKTEFRLF